MSSQSPKSKWLVLLVIIALVGLGYLFWFIKIRSERSNTVKVGASGVIEVVAEDQAQLKSQEEAKDKAPSEDKDCDRDRDSHSKQPDHVVKGDKVSLKASVLKQALIARQAVIDNPKINVKKPNILTVVDYSIRACKKRVFVIDLKTNKILMATYTAHGKGSGSHKVSDKFSNQGGSHASTLGMLLTTNKYFGSKGCSLRLQGLEPGINDNAESRAVVVHSADYVSEGRAKQEIGMGRSWGCIVVPKNQLKEFVSLTKDGSLIYNYYPSSEYISKSNLIKYNVNVNKEMKAIQDNYHLN